MRAGSAARDSTACATAAASACTRASAVSAEDGATITWKFAALPHASHCAASAGSTTAIAGRGSACGKAKAASHWSRLIVAQAAANFLDERFDLIGFLQSGNRNHVAIGLFDLLLQLFAQFHQTC